MAKHGMFGDKRVSNICQRIRVGRYQEPDKLIWQFIKEDRITPNQLAMIVNAIKESGAVS